MERRRYGTDKSQKAIGIKIHFMQLQEAATWLVKLVIVMYPAGVQRKPHLGFNIFKGA